MRLISKIFDSTRFAGAGVVALREAFVKQTFNESWSFPLSP
jgi:hypothetical protein